ncbi:MAG TPA: PRC-barrel domain-containing protein [Candidatus Bathyarchaeia archaeon]|nr:PRC-barrel domain-containing protein [Candidatus Bathyarchaeia archaeon]
MLVPFGTHVVDRDGKSVGTVSRVILHPQSQEMVALVVQQGVLDRREIVVPVKGVSDFRDTVRLTLRASELAGLDLFDSVSLRTVPDHWKMPAGFDVRSFFLMPGDGWTEAMLPFILTSPAVSGTPGYAPDPAASGRVSEPAVAKATPVYDSVGQRLGEVEGVEVDPASDRITRVIVRRGVFFHTDTPVPASWIASVGDRITLNVSADKTKTLKPLSVG